MAIKHKKLSHNRLQLGTHRFKIRRTEICGDFNGNSCPALQHIITAVKSLIEVNCYFHWEGVAQFKFLDLARVQFNFQLQCEFQRSKCHCGYFLQLVLQNHKPQRGFEFDAINARCADTLQIFLLGNLRAFDHFYAKNMLLCNL